MLNYYYEYKKIYINNCFKYFKKEKDIINLGVWFNIMGIIFNNLVLVLILCLGGYMMLNGYMIVGMLFLLIIYV